jgi:hypothetical protein
LNLAVDVLAFVAFFGSSLSEDYMGFHLAASIVFVAAILVHLVLHLKWLVRMSKKVANKKVVSPHSRTNYYIDIFMLATFLLSAISGFALMLVETSQVTKLHSSTSLLFIIGALAHVALHWKSFVPRSLRARIAHDRSATNTRTSGGSPAICESTAGAGRLLGGKEVKTDGTS